MIIDLWLMLIRLWRLVVKKFLLVSNHIRIYRYHGCLLFNCSRVRLKLLLKYLMPLSRWRAQTLWSSNHSKLLLLILLRNICIRFTSHVMNINIYLKILLTLWLSTRLLLISLRIIGVTWPKSWSLIMMWIVWRARTRYLSCRRWWYSWAMCHRHLARSVLT